MDKGGAARDAHDRRRPGRRARLNGPAAEALSGVLLAAILLTAITRPKRLPEAAVAVPAVLVLGHLCQEQGLFAAAGAWLARASRGSPVRLLTGVFGIASVTTAVLSLDTTVVLLTPVVHDTAIRLRVRAKPQVYACTHLANSASLLLPVSNLTNLLAYSVAGITLIHFAGLMALPWVVAIGVEYLAFRWF